MKTYEKPIVITTDGIAEGIYTASGDTGEITATKGETNQWSGENYFSISISSSFAGKHVIMTFNSNKALSGGHGPGPYSYSGSTATMEHWNAPTSFSDLALIASDKSTDIQITSCSIQEV